MACFCAGTMIVTLNGEVPVESVVVGDLVLTLSGEGAPLKPVIWTGRVGVDLASHPDPMAVRPIRIAAGAIEPGMPIRDLLVSPDHGISVEDGRGRRVLVPAHFLVNGATVTREPATGVVTYHHIETATHEILMADGMAVESFFHLDARRAFGTTVVPFSRNAVTLEQPDFSPNARETNGVAPLLVGLATHEIHARLLAVARASGHVLTEDADLAVLCGDDSAEKIADDAGEAVFLLPPGAGPACLSSRLFTPAEADPAGGDQRRLGVALARAVLDGVEIPLDGPEFGAGFLPHEGEVGNFWRWTTGEATLHLPARDAEATLEITLHCGWSRYWLAPP